MGFAMKKYILFLIATALVSLPGQASAQRQFELIPSISVSETYDDNIDLTQSNEQSDFITTATPALTLNVLTQNTSLGMTYAPSFVWYNDFTENDTTRHRGTVSWDQQLTQRMSFNLTNTYLRSEDPLEDTLDVQGIRQTRNKYWVNTARASVGYVFGAENRLDVGYGRADRNNDEITLDNSVIQTPFANMTYWFNVKNGFQLNYGYTDAKFTRDDNLLASSDYTSNAAGIRYMRRFTPRSTAYLGYTYTTFDYERILPQDYNIHDPYVPMDTTEITKYLDMARRRKYWIIIPFLVTILAGLAYVLTAPKVYEAQTLILVQAQSVPQDLVRSIVTESVEDRLRTITQQVTSRTNLEKIIRDYRLDA
jgi:hypothetical protein